MASDFEKPDRVHTLFYEEIPEKMWTLPVGDLFTCGKSGATKLKSIGIRTIGELAGTDENLLCRIMGNKTGKHLHDFANGIDDDPVRDVPEEAKGYSAETTVEEDLDSIEKIDRMLMGQADVVAARMRRDGARCRCVGVTLRGLDFKKKSHQVKLDDATDVTDEIYSVARQLVRECWKGEPLRLIGLSLMDVDRDGYEQMTLFANENRDKHRKLDNVLDDIRTRYGNASIKRASTIDVDKRIGKKYK